MSGEVHLCVSPVTEALITRNRCPTCEKSRYFVMFLYEWYGPSVTCLRCGEHWEGEERSERPFMRGWRQKSVEDAKRRWRRYKGAAGVRPAPM